MIVPIMCILKTRILKFYYFLIYCPFLLINRSKLPLKTPCPYQCQDFSLFLIFLNFNKTTPIPKLLFQICQDILEEGLRDQKEVATPLFYQWHNKQYIGAAHGYVGILYLLLQVSENYALSSEVSKCLQFFWVNLKGGLFIDSLNVIGRKSDHEMTKIMKILCSLYLYPGFPGTEIEEQKKRSPCAQYCKKF